MTENERHEKIIDFIRKNPGKKNKADVMRFMKENDVSEPTTFKDLTYLIGKGLILELKEKPNSQTHYLVINDENEFNIMEKRIDEWYPSQEVLKNFEIIVERVEEFADYMFFEQLFRYIGLSEIANKIGEIEPRDKREILYSRLLKILEASAEVNKLVLPILVPRVDEFFKKTKKITRNKKTFEEFKHAWEYLKKEQFEIVNEN